MGKNHKHKKNEKLEKAKVKLRSGKTKFLPKGQNVTDTNFKIKPIVIREQLRSHSLTDVLTRKQLNVKDLISRLKHYNAKIKTEGCDGLVELIVGHGQQGIGQNLAEVFQNASLLMLDQERKVRERAVKLLSTILERVPVQDINPFFNILISYTTCAMTNINKDIQEDSLLIFDAIIKFTPTLIPPWFDKVFANFLSLISKLSSSSRSSTTPRTLTLNLGSKLTSVKWRMQVLSRLENILGIMVKFKSETPKSSSDTQFDVDQRPHHLRIYATFSAEHSLDFFSESNVKNTENQYETYVNDLVPLLQEIWCEVDPSIQNAISQEAANILRNILIILNLLWQLLNTDDRFSYNDKRRCFYTKSNQNLLSVVMRNFPYHQKIAFKARDDDDDDYDPKCVKENLLICLVLCRVLTKQHIQEAKLILKYLNRCVLEVRHLSPECMDYLLSILEVMLVDSNYWMLHERTNMEQLLGNCLQVCTGSGAGESLLQLLCDCCINTCDLSANQFDDFLQSLPSMLCRQSVSEKIIDVLSVLVRRNNAVFQSSLLHHQGGILDNIDQLRIRNTLSSNQSLMKIINLFYYTNLKESHLKRFEQFAGSNPDSKATTFIRQLMQIRNA